MEGTLGQEGTWVLPAYDVNAMRRCAMRTRVWKRADGGVGKKSRPVNASLREKPEEGFGEWVLARGIQTDNVWGVYLECTLRHAQGYMISSSHLTPARPTPPLTYTTSIWKGMPKLLSLGWARMVPITGLFVNVQSLSANKWKEVKSSALRMPAAISSRRGVEW